MRLCTNCYQITVGEPLFCNRCGRSYNRKLCPQKHVNPRSAQVCSQCGSKDLSTPQPNPFFLLRPLIFLIGLGPGFLFLAIAAVYLAFYIHKLFTDPNGLLPLMCLGFLLGLLLFIWMTLPHFLRNLLKKIFKFLFRRKHKEQQHKH